MRKRIAFATVALLALFATSAFAMGKGTSMFAIQLGQGTADLYDPFGATVSGGGFISAYDHSEIGVQAQYWNMMSDDYAFTVAGGIGFFSEEDKPGTNATPGDPTFKYSQSSWQVRVGGDRVVSVGERALLYFGPGVEFWSGKNKFEGGSSTVESENVSRISLHGRIGAVMMIGSNWGFAGDVGHKIGHATAEDQGAKATWWPSSVDSHGGLFLTFGGSK